MVFSKLKSPIRLINSTSPENVFDRSLIFPAILSPGVTNRGSEISMLTGSCMVISEVAIPSPLSETTRATARRRPSIPAASKL